MFNNSELNNAPVAGFVNHYDEHLNKCFVAINSSYRKVGDEYCDETIVLDAFERSIYGTYLWCSNMTRKYWEVPPVSCYVRLASGLKLTCSSDDEFNNLIEQYFGVSLK